MGNLIRIELKSTCKIIARFSSYVSIERTFLIFFFYFFFFLLEEFNSRRVDFQSSLVAKRLRPYAKRNRFSLDEIKLFCKETSKKKITIKKKDTKRTKKRNKERKDIEGLSLKEKTERERGYIFSRSKVAIINNYVVIRSLYKNLCSFAFVHECSKEGTGKREEQNDSILIICR